MNIDFLYGKLIVFSLKVTRSSGIQIVAKLF